MKPLKMLGLVAIAALTGMAFVGTSAAIAEHTALCAQDESLCKNPITHVHENTVGHATLSTYIYPDETIVECAALFLGYALNGGLGEPLIIHGAFTYTCLNGCTAKEENGFTEIKVLKQGTELARVTGEGLVHVICGLNCRYNGVGLEGHALGALIAENGVGEVVISNQTANKESGLFCPTISQLDITTEPLKETYIVDSKTDSPSSGATALCGNDEATCSSPKTHIHEESIGHALLLSSFATVQCEALFLGDTLNSGLGNPLVIHGGFTYTCLNGCTATEENGPAEIQVIKPWSELAFVSGKGLVHVVCGLNCRYNGVILEGHALDALTAENGVGEVVVNEQELNKESGTFCPKTSKLDITTEPLSATYISA